VGTRSTRDALLEHGALLFARHGVSGVSARALHEAVGARNESALHYHFGSQQRLVEEILRIHLTAVEERRSVLVADLNNSGTTGDVRALVGALVLPMAADLATPLGRAHLRIVAQLSHPSLAYDRAFRSAREVDVDAAAGTSVVRWLQRALPPLPVSVRTERLVDLRGHLLSSFGLRAQLIDDDPHRGNDSENNLFVENLVDVLVAGLTAEPSPAALAAGRSRRVRARRS
jgi:AcrR family transcriptional regulator